MEQLLQNFEQPPPWAKNWCDFYLLSSAFTGLTAILTLIMLVLSFDEIKKRGLVFLYMVGLLFQAVNTMVFYWICKKSLK
jgi:hypothetical protein